MKVWILSIARVDENGNIDYRMCDVFSTRERAKEKVVECEGIFEEWKDFMNWGMKFRKLGGYWHLEERQLDGEGAYY